MSTVPVISIITPVWNGLPYFKECIASVLAQEFQDWELLIGDNGSTDGTRDFLDTLTDSRIQVYKHEKNLGISGNLNFLFSKAKASLAHILCADDYLRPKGLIDVIDEWHSSGPGVAFISFDPDPGGSKLAKYALQVLSKNIYPTESILAFFLFGNIAGNLSNVSVRVSVVNSTGGFPGHLKTALDFEMWRNLAKDYELVISRKDVVFVRQHIGSATIYMTKKGEDYGQLLGIYEDLVGQLSVNYDRKKLISYFSTNVCPQYFRTAIKYALSGNFVFMKTVLSAKSVILWPIWRQLLVCTPLAFSEKLREYLLLKKAKNLWGSRKMNGTIG